MINRDPQTGNLVVQKPDSHVFFDLWRNDRWIGMSSGVNENDARKQAVESMGAERMATVIMTPYMGRGTSQATYKTLTGRDCLN